MVNGYIATLSYVLERDGASDSCCAAGYGSRFGEKEVVRHGGVFWRGILVCFLVVMLSWLFILNSR